MRTIIHVLASVNIDYIDYMYRLLSKLVSKVIGNIASCFYFLSLLDSYAIGYSDFGRGEGLIHLSNFACDGSEDRLFDCGASPIGQHFCHHGEDAGLICQGNACC